MGRTDRDLYGTVETNGLPNPKRYHEEVTYRIERSLAWNDRELRKVTRLRLVSDPGFPVWNVTYCHGVDVKGKPVNVLLPFSQLPKKKLKRAIIAYAKKDSVYAKGLGVFDAISTLV